MTRKAQTFLGSSLIVVCAIALTLLCCGTSLAAKSGMPGILTDWQYATFAKLVKDYFESNKIPAELDGDVVRVSLDSEDRLEFGLTNLAQSCARVSSFRWKAMIKAHFDSLLASQREKDAIKSIIHDYPSVKSHLAVRIYPSDYLSSELREHAVFIENLQGALTVLVFDLPTVIQLVVPEEAAQWRLSNDELFRDAIERTWKSYPPVVSTFELKPFGTFVQVGGDPAFGATNVLTIHRIPECLGEHGALVCIPTSEQFIAYPINGPETVAAVHALIMLAADL